ncbi:uncharacterized protein LOC128550589 [Mercenaria mercenaria]|uniref:uncharacterized protein LOC128550589 n=1 Tax=Mercenaria mercenaria TaxID=6596 RepID=UPI00234F8CEB|nr:uncharacterized protein LOC128550589 [Mercenaria mercenaria]
MEGGESTGVSEDALPLPAMPTLDTQLGVSATENVSQTIEMQNVAEDQTLPKRPRLQTSDGESLERRSASVIAEISPPHDRWAFNLLIVNLSRNITDAEFRQMKEVYKGNIPRKILNSFKTPMDLFDMMQKTLCLTPVNLLQLEGIFWNLGRQDLMDQVIEYGRKTGNVIYFQPASLAPGNTMIKK